jgi:hypothetical protein
MHAAAAAAAASDGIRSSLDDGKGVFVTPIMQNITCNV